MYRARIGEESQWAARWYYGLAARPMKGHGPWQWPVEQSHGRLKRISRRAKASSLEAVCDAIKGANELWTSVPSGQARDSSLIATPNRFGVRPRWPDEWMMSAEPRVYRVGKQIRRLSTFKQIMNAHLSVKRGQTPFVVRRTVPHVHRIFFVMSQQATPRRVQETMATTLLAQARAKTTSELQGLWMEQGILHRGGADAPVLLNLQQLKVHRSDHCLVVVRDRSVDCSCSYSRIHGNCTHEYVAAEVEGLTERLGFQVPNARVGQHAMARGQYARADEVGRSADEG